MLTFPLSHARGNRSLVIEPQSIRGSLHKSIGTFSRIAPMPESPKIDHFELQKKSESGFLMAGDENSAIHKNDEGEPDAIPTSFKILVVDDSALVRKMSIKLMKSLGHSCEEADDGDVAVSLVRSNQIYDIILMDNQMPRMTGEEAVLVIRNELCFSGMIFGVTGNALAEDIQSFIDKGADDVIIKPLNAGALNNAIEKTRKKAIKFHAAVPIEASIKNKAFSDLQ